MSTYISNRWINARVTPDVLVPAWIGLFGFVALTAPPVGALPSLGLFLAGVVIIPTAVLLPRVFGGQPQVAVQP